MRPSRVVLAIAALASLPAVAFSQTSSFNEVVLRVRSVSVPTALPGPCRVIGVVSEVKAGGAFRPGQPLSIDVPCTDGRPHWEGGPAHKSGPAIAPLDPAVLQRSTAGLAELDDAGRLVCRPSRRMGFDVGCGYRVLALPPQLVSPAQQPL